MGVPPRPHALARSRTAEVTGRLVEGIWDKGLQRRPALEPESLWQVGARRYDAKDEIFARGEAEVADFRERLSELTWSLREEARLNALGHVMAYGQLTGAIRKRHALGRMWRRNPGIWKTPIAAPIIVVGQMRSGTTRMHRLLAADPAHAGTRFCNSMDPVRPLLDYRPLKSRVGLALARRFNPWLDTLHPFGATRADEELPWLSQSLGACAFEAQYRIPAFVAFSEARDAQAIYREFSRVLRSDAAMMRNAALPRVLKCPQYAEDLAALLAQFPDARVVVTRRASEEVLASTVSLVASQMAFQSDLVDLGEMENEWRRKLGLREQRMAAALKAFSGPVVEVEYERLGEDWQGEIARVYHTLRIDLTREAMAAMLIEQGRADRSQHRSHAQSYGAFDRANRVESSRQS